MALGAWDMLTPEQQAQALEGFDISQIVPEAWLLLDAAVARRSNTFVFAWKTGHVPKPIAAFQISFYEVLIENTVTENGDGIDGKAAEIRQFSTNRAHHGSPRKRLKMAELSHPSVARCVESVQGFLRVSRLATEGF